MSRQAWNLLALLALLWGGSFSFVGVAVRDTPALVIVLARVGVAALAGFSRAVLMFGSDVATTPVAAGLARLAETFCYPGAGLWGRRFKRLRTAPLTTAAGQTSVATLLLLPRVMGFSPPQALLGLALLSTALAYLLYFRILDLAGPVNLLLVTLLIPVVAVALGVVVLGESLGAQHAAGLGLIALGLALIDGRASRRRA